MSKKRGLICALVALCLVVATLLPVLAAPSAGTRQGFQRLQKPGEKIPLGSDHYFIYGFDKQPKIGVAIMRVEIFDRDGKRNTSYLVKGDADMPSMRGAHSSGGKDFTLSAKGVYLLPVRLVMPGDWELTFTFLRNGEAAFHGVYQFDI